MMITISKSGCCYHHQPMWMNADGAAAARRPADTVALLPSFCCMILNFVIIYTMPAFIHIISNQIGRASIHTSSSGTYQKVHQHFLQCHIIATKQQIDRVTNRPRKERKCAYDRPTDQTTNKRHEFNKLIVLLSAWFLLFRKQFNAFPFRADVLRVVCQVFDGVDVNVYVNARILSEFSLCQPITPANLLLRHIIKWPSPQRSHLGPRPKLAYVEPLCICVCVCVYVKKS